jgi:phosphomannomutase
MIPRLLVAEWVSDRFEAFPSLGGIKFRVDDARTAIEGVLGAYRGNAISFDEADGVSLEFDDRSFNLRRSNTEPLVPLNVEGKGKADTLAAHVSAIAVLLGGARG